MNFCQDCDGVQYFCLSLGLSLHCRLLTAAWITADGAPCGCFGWFSRMTVCTRPSDLWWFVPPIEAFGHVPIVGDISSLDGQLYVRSLYGEVFVNTVQAFFAGDMVATVCPHSPLIVLGYLTQNQCSAARALSYRDNEYLSSPIAAIRRLHARKAGSACGAWV